ncbi:MAG: hypothetical protein ABIH71_04220 [Candidatus Omnitrophota bacterium]
MGVFFAILIVSLSAGQFCLAKTKDLKEANNLFEKKQYHQALEKYNDALTDDPNSSIINYGAGCANYKSGEYQQATDNFNKGLLTDRQDLAAKAYYNIGNSKYRLAENNENANLEEAITFYKESLEYYKKAIDKNQEDTDAKYNYEVATRRLEAALEKEEKQPQQNQQKKDQSQEEKDQKESNEKEESQAQREQKQQQEEADRQDEDSKDKQEEQSVSESGDEKENMSEEEARMLIESFSEEALGKEKKKVGTYSLEYQDW